MAIWTAVLFKCKLDAPLAEVRGAQLARVSQRLPSNRVSPCAPVSVFAFRAGLPSHSQVFARVR
eukprot:8033094-Lingulodinium_polyedra.AAC.1